MIRTTLLVLAATCALQAQTTNPTIADAKRIYSGIKGNLTRAAEKMPEDLYSYKPVPEIRTFGALVGHIADSQLSFCSAVHSERKQGTAEKQMTAKAEIVAALAASFAECDAAWDSITDATAVEMLGTRSKLGLMIQMTAHSDEEYGYLSVYMRLKNIVPPSSDNAGRGGQKKGE